MWTAEQAREIEKYNIEYCNEFEVYIDKQIALSAYDGKSECTYNDILPSYIKDILERHGYTIIEEWWNEDNGWLTHIKW